MKKKAILVATLILVASCARQPVPTVNSATLASPASVTGVRIVFEVDVTADLHERLEAVEDDIRQSMRKHGIAYSVTPSAEGGVSICILNKTQRDDAQIAIKDVIGKFEGRGSEGVSSYHLVPEERNCFVVAGTVEFREEFLNDVMSREMFIAERRATFGGRPPASTRRLSDNRFQLDVPGLVDLDRMRNAFAVSADVSFRLVNDNVSVDDIRKKKVPQNTEILEQQPRAGKSLPPLAVYRDAVLPGTAINRATMTMDSDTETPVVTVYMDDRYVDVFAIFTKKNVGCRLAIVLNGEILAAPIIWAAIAGGALEISNDFTEEQATDFANQLNSGSVPTILRIVDLRIADMSKP